jgi:hypothetical protein
LASAKTNVKNVRRENKKKINRYAKPKTENWIKKPAQVKKPVVRASKKTAGKRRKLQASVLRLQGNSRQKINTAGQNKPSRNLYAKSTVTGRKLQTNRSGKTVRASRSYTNSRIGSSFARSGNQQRSYQNSARNLQRSGARGRRW